MFDKNKKLENPTILRPQKLSTVEKIFARAKKLITDKDPNFNAQYNGQPSNYRLLKYICEETGWEFPQQEDYLKFVRKYLKEIKCLDLSRRKLLVPNHIGHGAKWRIV